MTPARQISKADARRALVQHHFSPFANETEVFERLRSVQFDPIAPAGCNHDLVFQSRLPTYQLGEWEDWAYQKRQIYDGWDKQASLVPFSGWPARRYIHKVHRREFEEKIFKDHKQEVELILAELKERGPLQPKDFDLQMKREEWRGSWFGPNVTKQILRALWHDGTIVTASRKSGQHVYDLAERVVPPKFFNALALTDEQSKQEIALDRHHAMGFVRPTSSAEIWSYSVLNYDKKEAIASLASCGKVVPVEIDGMKAHATPEFLQLLDHPVLEPKVRFIAPLDQILWDRKFVEHIFGFEYTWEIYTPEAKRRWGYYVLPVMFGDQFVARIEFFCRAGVLEVRQWHIEASGLPGGFWDAFKKELKRFMRYCRAEEVKVDPRLVPTFEGKIQ